MLAIQYISGMVIVKLMAGVKGSSVSVDLVLQMVQPLQFPFSICTLITAHCFGSAVEFSASFNFKL